jgi:hypothetical protein
MNEVGSLEMHVLLGRGKSALLDRLSDQFERATGLRMNFRFDRLAAKSIGVFVRPEMLGLVD